MTRSEHLVLAAATVVGIAFFALVCGLGVRHGCVAPPPPVSDAPDPGTPRAALCDAVGAGQPWSQMIVTLAVALPLFAVPATAWRRGGLAALLLANVALIALAMNLSASTTI